MDQTQQGAGVSGSRLKLGVLSGAGNNIASVDSLETFTLHGYGYGLLTADLIEPFLLPVLCGVGTRLQPRDLDRVRASITAGGGSSTKPTPSHRPP